MTEQQAVASPGGLGDWKPQEEWRRLHAGHLFETPDSWQWFMRTYRKELLEAGAIGLIAGRIFVHAERIEPAIEKNPPAESQTCADPAELGGDDGGREGDAT